MRTFLELPLLGIALDDGTELGGSSLIVVTLKSPDAVLVHRERLVVTRLSWRGW
jgi:hypothetical protein